MYYFSSQDMKDMPEKFDAVLRHYFPNKDGRSFQWGVANVIVSKDVCGNDTPEVIEICKFTGNIGGKQKWEHYCHIQRLDDTNTKTVTWEVNSQFNGKGEDEMWIFKTFRNFGSACRFVQTHDIKALKPAKIYK